MKNKFTFLNTSKLLTLSFLILFSSYSLAQKKQTSLVENFVNTNSKLHTLQIEKFFLHTNKTRYVAGEKVWFKAYVVNDVDNKPSLTTTNLHLNVFDANKDLVSSQLYLVENGVSSGELKLENNLNSGTYYLELTTQWNQNFDNNAYVTAIDVIANDSTASQNTNIENTSNGTLNTSDTTTSNTEVNVTFFPHSNVFLENIVNVISFTTSINGNAYELYGDIIDDQSGIIVAKLDPNSFGMGSFELYARPQRTYTAFVNHNGIQYKFPLPKAQLKGMVVQKHEDQSNDEYVAIELKTNEGTIKDEAGNYAFAVLHRNGKERAVIPVKLKKQYINYSFTIAKHNLFDGVNSLTLFNSQNKPIADYAFFYAKENPANLSITVLEQEKDSLSLDFIYKNAKAPANLSISFLPEQTKVFNEKVSMHSAFLLAPYLEDKHVDLNKFFATANTFQNIQLLLNTGKKKNSLPYTFKPKYYKDGIVKSEHGLTVKGNVSSNVKDLTGYKVMLSSDENELLIAEEIGASNSFEFDSLYLNHPTKYKLALLDPQGKIIKSGFRVKKENTRYTIPEQLAASIVADDSSNATSAQLNEVNAPELLEDMETLDEVRISIQKKRTEELKSLGIPNRIGVNDFSNVYVIKENEGAVDIYQYLQRLPFVNVVGDRTHFMIVSTRGNQSIIGNRNMGIMIDGLRYVDTEILVGRRANEFSAIVINLSGTGHGIYGFGGVISFYTRNSFGSGNGDDSNDFVVGETSFGFSNSATRYEGDALNFINELSRMNYGTVDWVPNFKVFPNKPNNLKIDAKNHSSIMAIIRGISANGDIVSEIINIPLEAD